MGIVTMRIIHADNLKRLMNCNGSLKMAGNQTPAISGGEEGIAALYAAYAIFNGLQTPETLRDTPAPNGVFITDTILENVLIFVNAIRKARGQMNVDVSFGAGNWRVEGAAHHVAFVGTTLYVDQFAFGWGIIEPENNWGLIAQAVGFCINYHAQPETVVLTVHQPRPSHPLGPCRDMTFEGKLLFGKYRAAIFEVMNAPSDNLRSGLDWCRKCPALDKCPSARGAAMNAIDYVSQVAREDLDGEALAAEIIMLERAQGAIKERLAAMNERATHQITNGKIVPNFSLERHYSTRKLKSFVTPDMLRMLTGLQKVTEEKMLSPAKLELAGVPEVAVNSISERAETKPKLTRVDANKLAQHKLRG